MEVAINNNIYQKAQIYAQQQGLSLTTVIEGFLMRFIAKNNANNEQPIPDVVLSLLGAGKPIADDDMNAHKAYSRIVDDSLASQFSDFEDAMQYYTALKVKADAIITRNAKDFAPSKLPVMTAGEYLATLE